MYTNYMHGDIQNIFLGSWQVDLNRMGDLPLGSIDDRYDEQLSCMICMHVHICAIRLIIKYTYVPSNYGRLRGREKERERERERGRERE